MGRGEARKREGEEEKRRKTNTGKVRLVAQLIKRVDYDASKYIKHDPPDMIEGVVVVEKGKCVCVWGGGGVISHLRGLLR